jgi:hypothetical protein
MPFDNIDKLPPVEPYTWVPNVTPTGNGSPYGFYTTEIGAGQFRNDIVNTTVTVSSIGTIKSAENSIDYPFVNAFRFLANPSLFTKYPTDLPFILQSKSGELQYSIDLVATRRISAIKLYYSLSIKSNDSSIQNIPFDKDDLEDILKNSVDPNHSISVDMNKYKLAQVLLDGVEYPKYTNDETGNPQYQELGCTGFYTDNTNLAEARREIIIRFGDGKNTEDFPLSKNITIKSRYEVDSLKLSLYKVMIYNAERANIVSDQLPCGIMSYAFPVRFHYDPNVFTPLIVPTDTFRPNVHLKVFNPNYRTNSPGLAHSVNLRFLVFNFPILAIDPFQLLTGSFTSTLNLYWVDLIGLMPGRKTIRANFLPTYYYNDAKGAVINYSAFKAVNKNSIYLQSQTTGLEENVTESKWVTIEGSEVSITRFDKTVSNTGPWIDSYTYLNTNDPTYEQNSKQITRYRFVEKIDSGGLSYSEAFTGQLYSEKRPFKMSDVESTISSSTGKKNVNRRVYDYNSQTNLDVINPLALFFIPEDDVTTSLFKISKGIIKIKVKAAVYDKVGTQQSHLIARMWWVPKDFTPSGNDIHLYRKNNEIIFTTDADGNTYTSIGNPKDISEMLVSSPLPVVSSVNDALYDIEILRYVNHSGTMSTSSKIVVGIYAISNLDNNINYDTTNNFYTPSAILDIESSGYIETPYLASVSNSIYPQRSSDFNTAKYKDYTEPLSIVDRYVTDIKIKPQDEYLNYNKNFQISPSTGNAFTGLVGMKKLEDGDSLLKVTIPYNGIPTKNDGTIFVAADFATFDVPINGARINPGEWKIYINKKDFPSEIQNIVYSFEISLLLVNSTGDNVQRLFRTKVLETEASKEEITITEYISFPYLISNFGSQMVLRILVYPRSKSGKVVNEVNIAAELKPIKMGFHINELTILKHTMQKLTVDATDSLLGSPAFYEDLDLVPDKTLDGQDFWFSSTPDMRQTLVVEGGKGIDITGCLYSPSWFINMPKEMEVKSGALGFLDKSFYFRTVVGAVDQIESSISVGEDIQTNKLHIAYDEESSDATNTTTTGKRVRYLQTSYQNLNILRNYQASGVNNTSEVFIEGKNPSLYHHNTEGYKTHHNSMSMVVETIADGKSYTNTFTNMDGGHKYSWNRPIIGSLDREFNTNPKIAQYIKYPVACQSIRLNRLAVVGYCEPSETLNGGAYVLKIANTLNQTNLNQTHGEYYFIDGNKEIQIPNFTLKGLSDNIDQEVGTDGQLLSNGKAKLNFIGAAYDNAERMLIAYPIQSKPGVIFGRYFDGAGLSKTFKILDLSLTGILVPTEAEISNIAIAHYNKGNNFCISFMLGGRLFVTIFSNQLYSSLSSKSNKSYLGSRIYLVAGSRDFITENTNIGNYLRLLEFSGLLVNKQQGNLEENIPNQKPGLLVSNHKNHSGNILVWYRDSKKLLKSRAVEYDGFVSNFYVYNIT